MLAPGGRIVVATEDPASFDDVWFARFFPSVPAIERGRFPSAAALTAELEAAGFGSVRIERLRQHRSIARAQALDLIRSKAFSTFDLLDPREYDAGLARAEAELPGRLDYRFDWLLGAGVAETPGYPRAWIVIAPSAVLAGAAPPAPVEERPGGVLQSRVPVRL